MKAWGDDGRCSFTHLKGSGLNKIASNALVPETDRDLTWDREKPIPNLGHGRRFCILPPITSETAVETDLQKRRRRKRAGNLERKTEAVRDKILTPFPPCHPLPRFGLQSVTFLALFPRSPIFRKLAGKTRMPNHACAKSYSTSRHF